MSLKTFHHELPFRLFGYVAFVARHSDGIYQIGIGMSSLYLNLKDREAHLEW